MLKTRVSEILKIEFPIIQGGMVWAAKTALPAAVSNAGGLGQIAIGDIRITGDPSLLAKRIRDVNQITSKPFGVNVPLTMPRVEQFIQVGIDEGVKIFITSSGNPGIFTKKLKDQGITVMHIVPSVKLARKAEGEGVDIVVAEGHEAGGHLGFDDTSTISLVPQVVDAVHIPVVAAGGIGDARGFVAALALGAEGIQMGTRFLATYESAAHEKMKKAIIEADDTSTLVTAAKVHPARMLKNKLSQEIMGWEASGVEGKKILEKIGHERTRMALDLGNIDDGSPLCGQIAGLIKEILSAREVINRMIKETIKIKSNLDLVLDGHPPEELGSPRI